MPIYEFECEDCGRKVEHLFTQSEAKTLTFLECGKCRGRMKRLISATNHNIEGYSYKNLYGLKPKEKKKDGKTD